MSRYTGEKCLICSQDFKEDDDVVVCPECGTPYHKDCYKEKGSCVNKELHSSGESWKKVIPTGSARRLPEQSQFKTENAEQKNNINNDFQQVEFDSDASCFGLDPEEIIDESNNITLGETMEYVRSNRFFYLLAFKRLQNAFLKISINIVAIFAPEYYFASRKMYLWAAILTVLRVMLQIPATIIIMQGMDYAQMPGVDMSFVNMFVEKTGINESFSKVLLNCDVALRICFGLIANQLYFRNVVSRLKKLRLRYPDSEKYRDVVKQSGGISIAAMVVLLVLKNIFMVIAVWTLFLIGYMI
ncbi:MAG: DUF2628 domain-containing protein [Oscillospiraceae bacterium]|nr:DUF2628 domain-containing protein [Oscillospiraceae bacterium]MBQ9982544.1 DUF2628 domain-containing protein [Oscillospiraceae bacterium]